MAIKQQMSEAKFKRLDIDDDSTIKNSRTRQREFLIELKQEKDKLANYIQEVEWETYLIK